MERTKKDIKDRNEFQKTGGGSLRLPGRIIKPNQRFFAFDDEIPSGAWDVITRLSGTPTGPGSEEVAVVVEKPAYKLKHLGGGWYNIIDSEGKVMNEKGLNKDDAKEKLAQLEA